MKITGAAGAYTASFENMEADIAEVNKIIDRSSLKNEELAAFSNQIEAIENQLDGTVERMRNLDNSLTNTEQAILQGQYNLTTLRQDADRLHLQAGDIKDKATQLQEVRNNNVKLGLCLIIPINSGKCWRSIDFDSTSQKKIRRSCKKG